MSEKPHITKIVGRPGSGKTTETLDIAEKEYDENDVDINDLIYITYTTSAAKEGLERIAERLDYTEKSLEKQFRTLHSLCYELLNLYNKSVVTPEVHNQFCNKLGIPHSIQQERDEETLEDNTQLKKGNRLFNCYNYVREKMIDFDNIPNSKFDIDKTINGMELKSIFNLWESHKRKHNNVDFCDFLSGVMRYNLKPDGDVLIVDEFQDMTPLQYQVYDLWKGNMDRVYISADPCQSIYTFAGASPEHFVNERYDDLIEKNKTYRLPEEIWNVCKKIAETFPWVDDLNIETANRKGIFNIHKDNELNELDSKQIFADCVDNIEERIDEYNDIMILFRTRHQVRQFQKYLTNLGIPFKARRGYEVWDKNTQRLANVLSMALKGVDLQRSTKTFLGRIMGRNRAGKYVKGRVKNNKDLVLKDLEEMNDERNEYLNYYQINAVYNHIYYNKTNINAKQIITGTKHSSKGTEADMVITSFDTTPLIAKNRYMGNQINEDEKRVDFVALSRPRKELLIYETMFDDNCYHTLDRLQLR